MGECYVQSADSELYLLVILLLNVLMSSRNKAATASKASSAVALLPQITASSIIKTDMLSKSLQLLRETLEHWKANAELNTVSTIGNKVLLKDSFTGTWPD